MRASPKGCIPGNLRFSGIYIVYRAPTNYLSSPIQMRKLWLALTDARIRAALGALDRCGPALGDLSAYPEMAADFFPPLKQKLSKAAAVRGKRPGAGSALAAADNFTRWLEKTFADMALLEARPEALPHALVFLQRACALAPRLLAQDGGQQALGELRGLCASGRKVLAQAKTAAASARDEFTENLKFSTIYSDLDSAFDAFERCAEALSRL